MVLKKKDFIEVEFTGRIKGGEVFDSNSVEELEKLHAGHNHPIERKPLVFCLGEGMFLKGVDNFLIGKEVGEYTINLSPEEAFGKRDPQSIRMIPLKNFQGHNLNPIPGSVFNFDGKLAKVLTVSSGRVIVDFNNPLAGKSVEYKIKVLKKVENMNEKIKALNEFFFRSDFNFKLEGEKIELDVPKEIEKFAELFRDKYHEILGLKLVLKEALEKPIEKKESEVKEAVENIKEKKSVSSKKK
ncbi:MAG: peptidylprolyl isomerase [archaeon]|nr:peptidylprolyl isomerase [archaeon]